MPGQISQSRRHFLTDAAIYGLGTALVQAVSILLLPLYTRYLSPADFGVMEIIERIGNVMNICLMTNGLGQAAIAFYLQAKDQRDRERVTASTAAMLLVCFLLASMLAIAVAPMLANWLDVTDTKLLTFGIITVLTQLFLILPLTLMQARVESISFVGVSVAMSLVRIGLAILFVAYFGWGLFGVYVSMLITFALFGVGLTIRELCRPGIGIDWHRCVAIIRFSLPFVPTSLLGFLILNADRFFLLDSAGPSAVGIYSLGVKLAGGVAILSTTPLFKVWSARMYTELERPGGSRYASRILNQMLLIYSFVGMGVCLFHREVLTIVSRDDYSSAGKVIAPLVLANAFLFISTFMECGFYVRRRTILKPFTAFATFVVIICLYALLIPKFAIVGAAYATLFGYAGAAIITYFVAQRVLPIEYDFATTLKIVAISVLCYLPAASLELGLWQFSAKLGLLAAWVAAAWCSEVLRLDDFLKSFHSEPIALET